MNLDFLLTKFDKKTAIIIASSITIVLVIAMIIGVSYKVAYSSQEINICDTKECQKASAFYSRFVDKTVDPCENFYEFSCGRFLKNLTFPKHKTAMFVYEDWARKQIKKELLKPIDESDRRLAVLGKKFYQNCLNTQDPFKNKYKVLYNIMTKVSGGEKLSLVDPDWSEEDFDWTMLYKNWSNAGSALTSVLVIFHNDDYINLQKAILKPLGAIAYVKNALLKIIKDSRTTVNETYFDQQYDEALELYREIYHASLNAKHEATFEKTTEELSKDCPGINWLGVANVVRADNNLLRETEDIVVSDRDYLCKLPAIFKDRKRALSNHIMIAAMEDLIFSYIQNGILIGPSSRLKEFTCMDLVKNYFGMPASYIYMKIQEKKYGIQLRSDFGLAVNQTIIPELIKIIGEEATWYSQKVRDTLVDKIKVTKVYLGYLLATNDSIDSQIGPYEDVYKNLNITEDTVENIQNILAVINQETSKYIIEPMEIKAAKSQDVNDVVFPNAFYLPTYTVISYVLMGLRYQQDIALQFHNFGNMFGVAHELGHGHGHAFYDFDKTGSLEKFWDKKSEKEFRKRFNCLIEEYNKEKDPCSEIYVNGTLTAEENHADYIGVKVSSRTFQKLLDEYASKGIDIPKLPDFQEYSQKQMYWIASVLLHCHKNTKEQCTRLQKFDVHSVPSVRANMMLKLSEDFAKDWNCKSHQKMYHERKCQTY